MAKIIDITEKLNFDKNPIIKIRDIEIEVKTDAKTMLEIVGITDSKESEMKIAIQIYEKLFSEKDKKKIDGLNLSIGDFMILIKAAVSTVQEDEEQKE